MGNRLLSIPAPGQSGVQTSANPYATSTTYSNADLPTSVVNPGAGTTTLTYDAAFNVVSQATPAAITSYVYDGDNRACYQLIASTVPTGLTCASGYQAGSTATTVRPRQHGDSPRRRTRITTQHRPTTAIWPIPTRRQRSSMPPTMPFSTAPSTTTATVALAVTLHRLMPHPLRDRRLSATRCQATRRLSSILWARQSRSLIRTRKRR